MWRNRDAFFDSREETTAFLGHEWARELDYRLTKELWCYPGNRISVRFGYEWRDETGLPRGSASSPARAGSRR